MPSTLQSKITVYHAPSTCPNLRLFDSSRSPERLSHLVRSSSSQLRTVVERKAQVSNSTKGTAE